MRRRALGLVLLAATSLGLGSCSSGPVAGDLTISLATPNSDDGAIVVTVTASSSKEVTNAAVACGGCRLFLEKPSVTELRAVVTGNLAAGPLVTVSVSDTKVPASYTVHITQVASRTFQVRPTSGYSLTIP